jgi:hypothetical protein
MIDAKSMQHESPTDLLHVAVVGPENNGKSVLCTTAPGVKLFMDYDQKKQVLYGRKDVYAITFKNPGGFKLPDAAEEVLDILTGLETSLDLYNLKDKLGSKLFPDAPEGTIVKNIIHDSMASLGKDVMDYELYVSGDLKREIKIGQKLTINIPKNFDAWNAEMQGVGSVVMRSFALPINVFCIFHERAEEHADSTIEKPKFTGRVCLYPVRYKDLLLKYFSDIWRVRLTQVVEGNSVKYLPRVYVLPDFAMDSGTSMMLDAVEEPDISKMIAKHKVRSGQIKALPSSVPSVAVAGVSK